jgi:hypothetical protein
MQKAEDVQVPWALLLCDICNQGLPLWAHSATPCACLRAVERLADHRSSGVPLQWFGLVSAGQLVWGSL